MNELNDKLIYESDEKLNAYFEQLISPSFDESSEEDKVKIVNKINKLIILKRRMRNESLL